MAFVVGATLIGGSLGYLGAKKSAKSQDAATAASLAGFKQYEPYVDANLSGSEAAPRRRPWAL